MSAAAVQQRNQLVAQIESESASAKILGHVCWWNIRNVRLQHWAFRNLVSGASLNADKYAKHHTWRLALSRALAHMSDRMGAILEIVSADGNRIVIQATDKRLVSGEVNPEHRYEKRATVVIRQGENLLENFGEYGGDGNPQILGSIITGFNEERALARTPDVTAFVQAVFKAEADILPLRDSGGCYFVPAGFQETMQAVSAVVNQVGGEAGFQSIPMIDQAESRDIVSGAAASEIRRMCEELVSDIDAVVKGEKTAGKRWYLNRAEGIKEIQNRIGIYSPVLDESLESLRSSVDTVQDELFKTRKLTIDKPPKEE